MLVACGRAPALLRWLLDRLGDAARALPDGGWKSSVAARLGATPLPQVSLNVRRIEIAGVSLKMRPHVGEFDCAYLLSRHNDYETEVYATLARLNGHYDLVIDIGANVGLFTLFAARALAPRGSVIACEPNPMMFVRLVDNLAHNEFEATVHPVAAAIAEEAQLQTFYLPRGHRGTNGSLVRGFAQLFDSAPQEVLVAVQPASAFAERIAGAARVLIKIDVEGAEAQVLKGLRAIIAAHAPDLIIEILPNQLDLLAQISVVLDGYAAFHLTANGPERKSPITADPLQRDWFFSKNPIVFNR